MGGKDGCKVYRLEAATSDILHLVGQGNFTGKSQGILKMYVCGNHVYTQTLLRMHDTKSSGCMQRFFFIEHGKRRECVSCRVHPG